MRVGRVRPTVILLQVRQPIAIRIITCVVGEWVQSVVYFPRVQHPIIVRVCIAGIGFRNQLLKRIRQSIAIRVQHRAENVVTLCRGLVRVLIRRTSRPALQPHPRRVRDVVAHKIRGHENIRRAVRALHVKRHDPTSVRHKEATRVRDVERRIGHARHGVTHHPHHRATAAGFFLKCLRFRQCLPLRATFGIRRHLLR